MELQEWLLSIVPGPGYYVEAGAHDGIGDSMTKWLEDLRWKGLCVEPSSAFAGLQANRQCSVDGRCLWREDNQIIAFREVPGNRIELSGIEQCFGDHWDRSDGAPLNKTTVSLPTLLDEHNAPNRIDFFSLDTEGSELDILLGHDFTQYLFLAMIVEHNGVEKKRDAVRELLGAAGYSVCDDNPYRAIEDRFVHDSVKETS